MFIKEFQFLENIKKRKKSYPPLLLYGPNEGLIRDNCVKVKKLFNKGEAEEVNFIGKSISEIKELTNIKPVINKDKNQILGSVIYIDNYGNLITSIKESLFHEVCKSRSFTIFARNVKFKKIYKRYSQ